jgi:hypothetical protein
MSDKLSLLETMRLLNSEEFNDKPMAIVPKVKSNLTTQDSDINKKIVSKIFSLSKALSDEFGLNQRMVMEDIIKDLRIAGGEEILNVIQGDTPFDQLSKELATVARDVGIDSNVALNSLLAINEKDYVEAFRKFINRNRGQLPNFQRMGLNQRTRQAAPRGIGNKKEEDLMESLFKRILLTEGIEDIYTKYYSDIKRSIFDDLIKLDPTFNSEVDRLGEYGKWILLKHKQKKLKKQDYNRVREILDDFHSRKRFIVAPSSKNIFDYDTIDEVRAGLNNIELSKNQIAKQAKQGKFFADLGEEAELVFETNDWEVWSPKTYQASCKLGAGTEWCTARPSSDYNYIQYTTGYYAGKLYAFMPKDGDITKKVQLHIKKGTNKVYDFKDYKDVNKINPYEDFVVFINKNNLLNTLKQTELKNVDAILDLENLDGLKKGKPFAYAGGVIKEMFKDSIKEIRFVKEFPTDFIDNGAFKNCVNLETVYAHPRINLVKPNAFGGCVKLKTVFHVNKLTCFPIDFDFLKPKLKWIKEEDVKYPEEQKTE